MVCGCVGVGGVGVLFELGVVFMVGVVWKERVCS